MLKQINLDRMIQSIRYIFTQYIRNLISKIEALMDEKKIDDDVLFTFSSRNVRMEIKSHLPEVTYLTITVFLIA